MPVRCDLSPSLPRQISASPQLPFAILGDRVSCRRLGLLTIIVDRVDGVQWVALSASVKTDVLGWITVCR